MKRLSSFLVGLSLIWLSLAPCQQAAASDINIGPPPGAILDLAGQPLTPGFTLYSVDFTATLTSTDVSFLFRNDPGFTAMGDVSARTPDGPNLIVNGTFAGGLSPWTYLNPYRAPSAGRVNSSPCPPLDGGIWCDGATGAYDAISQVIPTTIGDTYIISFWLAENDITGFAGCCFQDLSTNGNASTSGNGVDTLVYGGAGAPFPAVPEPGSLGLFATGLLCAGRFVRRRRSV